MKAKEEKSPEDTSSNLVSHKQVQLKKMFKRLCDAGGFIISELDLTYAADQLIAGGPPNSYGDAGAVQGYFEHAVVQQKSRIGTGAQSKWSDEERRTIILSDLSLRGDDIKNLSKSTAGQALDEEEDDVHVSHSQKFQDVFLKTLIAVMAVDGEMNQDEVDVMGEIFHSVFSRDLNSEEINQHVSNLYDWWDGLLPELNKIRNQLDDEHKLLICRAAFMIAIPSRERKLLDSIFTALGLEPSATWQRVSIDKKQAA